MSNLHSIFFVLLFNGITLTRIHLLVVCDGAIVVLAGLCLTILHPGIALHGYWDAANYKLKIKGRCGQGV